MKEFNIRHVTRKQAAHNFELDDRLYGCPIRKTEEDWTLRDPELYLKRVSNELAMVRVAIDDMVYILREKGIDVNVPQEQEPSLEQADAHVFHKFHVRQFTYVEKLSVLLDSKTPEKIAIDIPKAKRQLNVLIAARDDLLATQVRFRNYAESMKKAEDS